MNERPPEPDADPTASGEDPPAPGERPAEPAAEPAQSLEEIRAAWRAERAAADPALDDVPSDRPPRPAVPFGFGSSVGEKWGARKVLYIVVGITLVAAIIRPALATLAILAGVAYWTADKLLAPGGRAAEAPEGSGFRKAHEMWRDIGLPGRIVVAVVLGVLLGLLTGTLGG